MAKKEAVGVHSTEVYPDDASDYPIIHQHRTYTTKPELPPQWPAEPHALTLSPATELWLLLYDVGLCLVPLCLIAKAILCLVADSYNQIGPGYAVGEANDLTKYLVRFNHQVCSLQETGSLALTLRS